MLGNRSKMGEGPAGNQAGHSDLGVWPGRVLVVHNDDDGEGSTDPDTGLRYDIEVMTPRGNRVFMDVIPRSTRHDPSYLVRAFRVNEPIVVHQVGAVYSWVGCEPLAESDDCDE